MHTTYRERRNRAAFSNAQLAYDRAVDPLWDQPDPEPEPEDEQEDDFIDTRLYDDMRRRLDAAADSRWAELRSTNT
ncbi:TPA: hypothetical protein ACWMHV_002426 [Pseudomonas aeruginosa]